MDRMRTDRGTSDTQVNAAWLPPPGRATRAPLTRTTPDEGLPATGGGMATIGLLLAVTGFATSGRRRLIGRSERSLAAAGTCHHYAARDDPARHR